MERLTWTITVICSAALVVLGCTDEGNPGSPDGTSVHDSASDHYTGGDQVVNPEGKEIGEACLTNSECKYNRCTEGVCSDPSIIIGASGECNWVDKADACTTWKCYYDDGSTICRHNDQDVPNGNYEWRCYDTDGQTVCAHDGDAPNNQFGWECTDAGGVTVCSYTGDGTGSNGSRDLVTDPPVGWTCEYDAATDTVTCTSTGDTSGEDGNVPGEAPGWSCTYSAGEDTTICINQTPDVPDTNPGWACEFPDGTDGGVKICVREGDPPPITGGCPQGSIEGYSCTPSDDAVSGATVTVSFTDCAGTQATKVVQSDALGYFVLTGIPVGSWNLSITKGPYSREETVTVTANQTTSFIDEDERLCFEPDATKIAVVGGAYDAIERVLDSLGFEYDFYPGYEVWEGWNFLLDASKVNTYDIIFINCGVHPEANFVSNMAALTTIGTNLRNYVDAGGYLYASDWAYYFVESAYPNQIDFRGDDLNPYDVLIGQMGLHAVAIVDAEMQAYTGMTTATINLDLPQWAISIAGNTALGVKTYLVGDARLMDGSVLTGLPYLMDFPSAAPQGGSVAYTAYHVHQNTPVNEFFTFIALNFK